VFFPPAAAAVDATLALRAFSIAAAGSAGGARFSSERGTIGEPPAVGSTRRLRPRRVVVRFAAPPVAPPVAPLELEPISGVGRGVSTSRAVLGAAAAGAAAADAGALLLPLLLLLLLLLL
jgi:hypothetical protein